MSKNEEPTQFESNVVKTEPVDNTDYVNKRSKHIAKVNQYLRWINKLNIEAGAVHDKDKMSGPVPDDVHKPNNQHHAHCVDGEHDVVSLSEYIADMLAASDKYGDITVPVKGRYAAQWFYDLTAASLRRVAPKKKGVKLTFKEYVGQDSEDNGSILYETTL